VAGTGLRIKAIVSRARAAQRSTPPSALKDP